MKYYGAKTVITEDQYIEYYKSQHWQKLSIPLLVTNKSRYEINNDVDLNHKINKFENI